MKIKSGVLTIIIFAVFILGIGGTMAFNLWSTESSKEPAKFTEGELAGTANPADIRGSYSFQDIENAFGVPVEDLAAAFEVTEDPENFQCKELEDIYGSLEYGDIGTGAVRLFVALYLEVPYEDAHEGTILPEPALDILGDRASPELREQMELVRTGVITVEEEEK